MNSYKNKMDKVQEPSYLKDKVIQEIQRLSGEIEAAQQKGTSDNSTASVRARKRWKTSFLSAAAVLLALAVIIPLANYMGDDTSNTGGSIDTQAENSFMLTAYAATPESESLQVDGLLTFGNAYGGASSSKDGEYGNWMFSVVGEDIVKVDFKIAAGQIYCFATQYYSGLKTNPMYESINPESVAVYAALRKKLGGNFVLGPSDYMLDFDDKDRLLSGHITGCRLLGSNASVITTLGDGAIDLGQVSFGFYLPAEELIDSSDYEDDACMTSTPFMASLDGQILEVAVTFSDGSSQVQMYKILIKKMKVAHPAVLTSNQEGRTTFIPYLPQEAEDGEEFCYVLLGQQVTEDGAPIHQLYEAPSALISSEFTVVGCTKVNDCYQLELDDHKNLIMSNTYGYTHTASVPLSSEIVVVDSAGNPTDLSEVSLINKEIRLEYYDVFYGDSDSMKAPWLVRGVSKIEILE